jgi:uncharacterized protein (DUF433 family)
MSDVVFQAGRVSADLRGIPYPPSGSDATSRRMPLAQALRMATDETGAPRIVSTPGTCGGRPRIAGTRMRVQDVVMWRDGGMSAEEMVEQFDLTPGQIRDALSYYHDHRDEIERDIREDEEFAERFLAEGHAQTSADLRARIEARRRAKRDHE